MAFRNEAHRQQVFRTPEYRRAISEWLASGRQVPLSVFQRDYGLAYYDRLGRPRPPAEGSDSQKAAFVRLMRYQGRATQDTQTWEDWLDLTDS